MMNPVEAVQSCLRKYAAFSGRAPRAEYWWFILFAIIVGAIALVIDMQLWGEVWIGNFAVLPLLDISTLLLFLPSVAVAVRRLHDIGIGGAGWVAFVVLIQIAALGGEALIPLQDGASVAFTLALGIAAIVLLVQYVRPSQPNTNQYGPPPYGAPQPPEEVFQ